MPDTDVYVIWVDVTTSGGPLLFPAWGRAHLRRLCGQLAFEYPGHTLTVLAKSEALNEAKSEALKNA